MKSRIVKIAVIAALLAPFLAFAAMAFGQTTQPTTRPAVRRAGVFAQPAGNLRKWYDGGTRVFIGWASTSNTSGRVPAQDRAAQLAWRDAVRKLGPDAVYVDYVLPDWRTPATTADVKLMVDDPQCLGFNAPDEFNRKLADGVTFSATPAQWKTYWDAIDAGDPIKTKVRVGDYSGELLSAAWGFYTGADMASYDARLTIGCTNWHPRNRYGDTRPDCDAYPGRAVRMLAKIAPAKPRWYISECANEKIYAIGRAPTPAELDSQYAAVMAEDSPTAPIEVWAWFPQEPHNGANHVFDATTPAQFEAVKAINARFAPTLPIPPPIPADPLAAMRADLDRTRAQLDAANARIDAIATGLRLLGQAATTQPSTQPTTVPTTGNP